MSDSQQSPDQPQQPQQSQRSPSPPDFDLHGVSRLQFSAWRNHPVTLAWRQYLADMAKDRTEAGTQAMLALQLTDQMQARIAVEVALLEEMADPQFDVAGAFYGRSRMTQEEWDAETAARQAAAGDDDDNDPYADPEDDDE